MQMDTHGTRRKIPHSFTCMLPLCIPQAGGAQLPQMKPYSDPVPHNEMRPEAEQRETKEAGQGPLRMSDLSLEEDQVVGPGLWISV